MSNFIEEIIEKDGTMNIITRFPPEPSGHLHLGHAKSLHLNFEMAIKFGGKCNLRFDDTNPSAEKKEYVDAIKADLAWLGYTPAGIYYTSDYFLLLHTIALTMIDNGLAYVCDLTPEEIAVNIGTTTKAGINSPYRGRSVDENLDLFERMTDGEFEDGTKVLRAKIDMSHPNMHMRDPIIYRIKNVEHHNTGNDWIVYPMYDFAHVFSDYIEGITHSICTLEFEAHRPLYEWFLENISLDDMPEPRQIEFSRLNLSHTIMSKRNLKELVEKGIVTGWDDPRMPTISGLRRRGVPAEAIRLFCEKIGVSKRENLIDMSLLDSCTRDVLNKTSNRRMVVFNPLKVTITNWIEPFDKENNDWLPAGVNPEMESRKDQVRMVNFGKNLFIEREDFMENPPKGFFRLTKGTEVRFKYGYYVTCNEVIKDADGNVIELLCTFDPNTKGGWSDDGRKVKGTIHWVNADNNIPIKVNLYDRLFSVEEPTEDFLNEINPNSIITVDAMMEAAGKHFGDEMLQFERNGYYIEDSKGIWNRTLPMKDGWKIS